MSLLFLSSENMISEQDMLLLISITKASEPFVYACPEGSWLASMAQHNSVATLELPASFWKQFFTLRLYIGRLPKKTPVQIHVLDAEALKLAKWLRRSIGSSITIVASFHDPIRLKHTNPFATSQSSPPQEENNTAEISSCLLPRHRDNTNIIRDFLAKKITCLFVSSPELYRVLEGYNMPYNSLILLPFVQHSEDPNFLKHYFHDFYLSAKLHKEGKDASSLLHMSLAKYDIKERFIFLVDTNIEEDSGLSILLQALTIIKEKILEAQNTTSNKDYLPLPKAIQVHICGAGSQFDKVLEEAKELEVEDMLAFFGDFDASLLYPNAHALLCLALAGEGNFRAILQAFRFSLPVVSSDISSHTKLLLTGKTQRSSLIFPRDNAQTLATSMLHIMTDFPLREELIIEGHEVLAKINYLDLAKQYQNALRKH